MVQLGGDLFHALPKRRISKPNLGIEISHPKSRVQSPILGFNHIPKCA